MTQSSSNSTKVQATTEVSHEKLHGTCTHCGGNGYMKTNPNCYHTCLNCLGRGWVVAVNSIT